MPFGGRALLPQSCISVRLPAVDTPIGSQDDSHRLPLHHQTTLLLLSGRREKEKSVPSRLTGRHPPFGAIALRGFMIPSSLTPRDRLAVRPPRNLRPRPCLAPYAIGSPRPKYVTCDREVDPPRGIDARCLGWFLKKFPFVAIGHRTVEAAPSRTSSRLNTPVWART